jgi:hypothetical protein
LQPVQSMGKLGEPRFLTSLAQLSIRVER